MGNKKSRVLDDGLLHDMDSLCSYAALYNAPDPHSLVKQDTAGVVHVYTWRIKCATCGTVFIVSKTVPYLCPYDARHTVDMNVTRVKPKDMRVG